MSQSITAFAVTEEDIATIGPDKVAGNVFIWFLCAIAFLKISQKIDSFMSSLGINVGNTGGSMMAELMIAARGLSSVKSVGGSSFFRGGHSSSNNSSNTSNSSFFSGGLAGAVGRQFTQKSMNAVTGQSSNSKPD